MRRELFESGARHHGIVTSRDCREAGVPASSFRDWRDREELDHPHHDVTVLPGHEPSSAQRLAIATAAIGPPCAVTGWGAAYLHGIRGIAPTTVDVLVPHGSSHRPHDGVRLLETSVFDHEPIDEVSGIPVVRPARMLADLSPTTDLDAMMDMAIDLRRVGGLGPHDLEAQLQQRRRFAGRRRFRGLAELLAEDGSDSGFEHRARGRLDDRGTPPDPGQLEVVVSRHHRRIDLPYAQQRVGVECRGLAYHGREHFDEDAERHNDFVEDATWLLLELTWTIFLRRWDEFCARLDRVLAARS